MQDYILAADFRKSFDLVDHNVIISELSSLLACPSNHYWMDQSFSNWPRTKCKGCNGMFILENSLPQDTKLGPILFTVLINRF